MDLAGQRVSKSYSKKRINLRSEKTRVEEELGEWGSVVISGAWLKIREGKTGGRVGAGGVVG